LLSDVKLWPLLALLLVPPVLPAGADEGAAILKASGVKGGLVVHAGCGTGRLTAALLAGDRYLVCGLDTDAGKIAQARAHIASRGLYGKVSAETFDGANLPFGDNMVNLLVLEEGSTVPVPEVERVLVPKGVAMVAAGTRWEEAGLVKQGEFRGRTIHAKPWPAEVDEWTHFLYDASGNAVSKDRRIRYPRHTQWFAGPRFSRHHDALASLSAMTSSNGRVFYIYDEGTISVVHRPPHWKLIARDAFNGKLLWKRAIPSWMTHLYNFRAGPAELPRRLVSVGERVYTTLGWNAPVVKLDAATGETLLTYPASERTEEIVFHDGLLLLVIGNPDRHIEESDGAVGYWDRVEEDAEVLDKAIVACDASSGRELWRKEEGLGHLVPLSLCARGRNLFYLDDRELHCVDARTGRPRWSSPWKPPGRGLFLRNYTPTVVAHEEAVLCLTWNRFVAYSIADGEPMWEHKGAIGFGAAGDVFAIGNTAWTFPMVKGLEMPARSGFIEDGKAGVGIDIRTGEITDRIPFLRTQHHHRCYRNKATEDCFLLGHSGIQVIDRETREPRTHRWVRGICQYGIMPANGYLYATPDPCRCYFEGKINGFFALSDRSSWAEVEVESLLEKGPAYGRVKDPGEKEFAWPTYRGNTARGGSTDRPAPVGLEPGWSRKIGDTLTAPVVAGGRLYVADRDAYTLHCLDARTGAAVWRHFAAGAVDSPPTICKGYCVFGCRDGSVYCLDAQSGALAWRFKTSRSERRIGWEDRLASPLWIHGSVLVLDEVVYFAAGHSSNLDGGIRLYGLELGSGKQLHSRELASGHWGGGEGGYGQLADILSSKDGRGIGMRANGFTASLEPAKPSGLRRRTAFLDGSWFHRAEWQSGGNRGKLIVFDEARSVAVGNTYTGLKQRRKVRPTSQKGSKWNQVGHFHQKFTRYLEEDWFPVGAVLTAMGKGANWRIEENLRPRAMVLAADTLCVAGWLDEMVVELKTGRARNPANPDPHEALLRVYSAADGRRLSELPLPSEPVFDGMAVAYGKVYLSTVDGSMRCFRAANPGPEDSGSAEQETTHK